MSRNTSLARAKMLSSASRDGRTWAALCQPVPESKAGVPRANDSLCSIRHLELAQDVGDVIAHGFRAEYQFAGNIGIPGALRDHVENLSLAIAEFWKDLSDAGRARAGEERHQLGSDRRAEMASPSPTARI